MKKERVIVWFRQDLRIHDNEALWEASHAAEQIVPVYVFDERVFTGQTSYGFPKTGIHRAQFIIESVACLRKNLQEQGIDLIVRVGKPEEILPAIAKELDSNWIYCNRERTQEEVNVQNSLEENLWEIGKELRFTRGKMLYYTSDLPFPVKHTPDSFSNFRKEVERFIQVREPLPTGDIDFQSYGGQLEPGDIPTLEDFGLKPKEKTSNIFPGGEDAALARLHYYLWESNQVENYKEYRDDFQSSEGSSQFSPYLAQGCLSPKMVYSELKKYEEKVKSNDSTYQLRYQLLVRDFYRMIGKKHHNKIFLSGGIQDNQYKAKNPDPSEFEAWRQAKTGVLFVDANMMELNTTGYLSNRGRQIVASYLIHDLQVHWLKGAEWFESILIDYDPCSNYGNWNDLVGIGSENKQEKYINVESQARRYDPNNEYIKTWLPDYQADSEFVG